MHRPNMFAIVAASAVFFLTSPGFAISTSVSSVEEKNTFLVEKAGQDTFVIHSFFRRGNNRDYPELVPPSGLTQSDEPVRDGRIILAQSKKQLGQGIANNTVRVDQLQEQVRQLTGQIEQLVFETQRLQEQIRLMQEDAEARFQELEGGEKRSDIHDPVTSDHADAGIDGEIDHLDDSTDAGPVDDIHDPAGTTGSIVAGSAGSPLEPLDLGAAARSSAVSTDIHGGPLPDSRDPLLQPNGIASLGTLRVSPDESADALYNLGYTQILNGDYGAAEENLRKFTQLYPDHALTPNARYWLGETFFARGQFSDAVAEFSNSYKTFPDGTKAPDSLLKLGISLARINERDAACATLAEMLNRFPDASRSLQIAAQDEQLRSNCT